MAADQKIRPEDINKIKTWLKEKWKQNSNCFVCGANDWQVPDDIIAALPYRENFLLTEGTVYPHIMCICNNCGHTIFFNAKLIGILEEEREQDIENSKNVEHESG